MQSLSKVLIQSTELGCAEEVLTVVSMLSVQNVWYRPKEKQAQARGESDSEYSVEAFKRHFDSQVDETANVCNEKGVYGPDGAKQHLRLGNAMKAICNGYEAAIQAKTTILTKAKQTADPPSKEDMQRELEALVTKQVVESVELCGGLTDPETAIKGGSVKQCDDERLKYERDVVAPKAGRTQLEPKNYDKAKFLNGGGKMASAQAKRNIQENFNSWRIT